MILSALKQLFTPDSAREGAHNAYVRLVAQARRPVFYSDWQVTDTLDGRFDIIVLHLFLVLERCEEEERQAEIQALMRHLPEVFLADMDRSLRELGVGDTGVGKRVKAMAQAFYGRVKAYSHAREDAVALAEALRRNVWRGQPVSDSAVNALVGYLQRNRKALQSQPPASLSHGHISFSD